MNNNGKIYACDIYDNRLKLIDEAARRLDINIIETCKHDGTKTWQEKQASFDRILLDAPCSGTGIIRRKPEIRYRQDKAERREIRKTQRLLLNQAVSLLKPGGILVYSTCSADPQEDGKQIRSFLSTQPELVLETVSERVTSLLDDGCDGFYMVKLKKL